MQVRMRERLVWFDAQHPCGVRDGNGQHADPFGSDEQLCMRHPSPFGGAFQQGADALVADDVLCQHEKQSYVFFRAFRMSRGREKFACKIAFLRKNIGKSWLHL